MFMGYILKYIPFNLLIRLYLHTNISPYGYISKINNPKWGEKYTFNAITKKKSGTWA